MSTRLRVRRFLVRQGRAVALLLAVAGLLFVVAGGYVYATPPTETVTEPVDRQSVSTRIVPSARVTGNTTLYEPGERLEDPSAFLFGATPTVDLAVRTVVPSGTAVTVDQRLAVNLSAANNGEVFWSEQLLLGAENQRVDDGRAGLTASLDVRQLRKRIDATLAELGDVGVFQTRLRLVVAYDTGRYQGRLDVSAPIVMTDDAYWFGGTLSDSRQHSREATRTVEAEPDMGAVATLELAGFGALAAAGFLARLRRDQADEVAIETEFAHSRNEEWISEGEFPTQTDKRFVHINTLEDLVDVAIDSNKRVIHDTDIEAYAVADGDLVYYFAPDRGDIDSWLDV